MQQSVNQAGSEKPRRKVVSLIRVSTAEQAGDDRGGIPRQRAVIERTVAAKDLDCVQTFELVDVSGTSVLYSPQIQEILRMVREREISGIVLADFDRLLRPAQWTDFALLQTFKEAGAIIYCNDAEYDVGSKEGFLMSGIRSTISGFERMLILERMIGSKDAKRRAGKCPSAYHTLPLGVSYDRRAEKFFYNEEIWRVQQLFRLFDEEGIHCYAELERRTGIKHATVKNLLLNPIFIGWRVYDEYRGGEGRICGGRMVGKAKMTRPEDEIIRVKVIEEPAIDPEVFERVGKVIAKTRFNYNFARESSGTANHLAGIGVCGFCGEPLFASTAQMKTKKRIGYYFCKANYYLHKKKLGGCKQPNMPKHTLDERIERFVSQMLLDPKILTKIINGSLAKAKQTISTFPGTTEDANAQVKKLRQKDKRLLDAYENGAIDLEDLKSRRQQIRRQIAELENGPKTQADAGKKEIEAFARQVVRGAVRFKGLSDKANKKEIIQSLFEEIHIRESSITTFRFSPDLGIPNEEMAGLIHLEEPFGEPIRKEVLPKGHKKCTRCGQVLPYDRFFRYKQARPYEPGNLTSKCKECKRARDAELRAEKRKRK